MADDPNKSTSWWSTLPGLFTAAAGVITAITGLVAILSQTGALGERSRVFVSQKAADVRDAVSPSTAAAPGVARSEGGEKSVVAAGTGPVVQTKLTPDGAASGIAATPLHSAPFTGAIVTRTSGSVVKVRDDVKEYCQGAPVLKTTGGQLIEMRRMARFEVRDTTRTGGNVHITLNNGETVDAVVEACAIVGSNDLGDFRGDFETIRSVEFVR